MNIRRIYSTNTFRKFNPSLKIYKVTKKEKEIQPQGFYRKNMRKNTHIEDAMLRGPSRGFGADERTGVSSGGGAFSPVDGGAVRQATAPATACGRRRWCVFFSGRALRACRGERERENEGMAQ